MLSWLKAEWLLGTGNESSNKLVVFHDASALFRRFANYPRSPVIRINLSVCV